MQNHPKNVKKGLNLMAKGIIECVGKLFFVAVRISRNKAVCMSTRSVMGLAIPAPRGKPDLRTGRELWFGEDPSSSPGRLRTLGDNLEHSSPLQSIPIEPFRLLENLNPTSIHNSQFVVLS